MAAPTLKRTTMRYFKKELVSNRLALPNGRQVGFEPIQNTDTGVLATEDAGLITELEKAIAARRGGVSEVKLAIFEELKKNPPAGRSQIRSLNAQSAIKLMDLKNERARPDQNNPRVAVNQPSAPMEVPRGLATVTKMKRIKELASQVAPVEAVAAGA